MNDSTPNRKVLRWCGGLLAVVVALRLLTLGLYPLTDTTEARYAEMARKMLDSGNWLTPMFEVGVPFWGKPPLSFWLSALPMAVAGVSEFTARLGPLLATVGVLALLWQWQPFSNQGDARNASKNIANYGTGIAASLIFISTPLGFIASGAVMTDMAMVAGTTLSMVGFWRTVSTEAVGGRPWWPWLFFVGQAIGLMAKGPVAAVLSGLALGSWVVCRAWQRSWRETLQTLWQRLPWLRGLALVAVLVLPWYVLAEQATPGFLRYFIVGEHWHRFTQSGWKGDLYGVAHAQPKGRIWLFALASTLPWVLAASWWAVKRRRMASVFHGTGELAYLLCWALAPCVFFTLSGNILPAYVLPGLPAFALLVARLALAEVGVRLHLALLAVCALAAPLTFTALVLGAPEKFDAFSDEALLRGVPPDRIVYLFERPDSGMFYTQGQARLLTSPEAIRISLGDPHVQRLLLPKGRLTDWQATLAAQGWVEQGRNVLSIAFGKAKPDNR